MIKNKNENTTYGQILDSALTLFSEQGYKAVTVAQIADKVGIKAPSLYKHFKNKQDIFNAIVSELSRRYEKTAEQLHLNGVDAQKDKDSFAHMDTDNLVKTGRSLFHYFLHDSYALRFRKMLTVEQFSNTELSTFYVKQYIDDPIDYQTTIFSFFTEHGLFVPGIDLNITALQFYSPIFLLIILCTVCPVREQEADELLEKHIRQFAALYTKP